MRLARIVIPMAAVATAGLALMPSPASAGTSTTNVTFEIVGGGLSIAAPASANLGQFAAGTGVTNVSGNLGTTTVTDTRGSLGATYSVTMTASNFTTGAASANETVLGPTVLGQSNAVTHTNTTPTEVAVQTTTGVAAAGLLPIMSLSAYNGNDQATYNPSVTIPVPATNSVGVYSGTITQTVS